MTKRPLTELQRRALVILRDSIDGVDRWNRVQQGTWNGLRTRGLIVFIGRRHHKLTDAGAALAAGLSGKAHPYTGEWLED